MAALRVVSMVLMLVLNGYLTRKMSPEDVAAYVSGTNILLLISFVGMAGLNQSIVRIVAGRRQSNRAVGDLLQQCWKVAVVFSLISTVAFYLLLKSGFGAWVKCDQRLVAVILICSLLVSVHKLLATSLRSVHALASSSVLEGRSGGSLANGLYLLVLPLVALTGLNAERAFLAFAGALAVTVPVGFLLLRRALEAEQNSERQDAPGGSGSDRGVLVSDVSGTLKFSVPFLLTGLLGYLATEFDVLLASAYTPEADTALFGTSRRLILQALAPIQILSVSVAASIARLYAAGDQAGLGRMLRYSATLGSVTTLPLLLICVIFPRQILSLVFGDFYADASTVFVIMAIGPAVNCLTGQCANLLMLSGHSTAVLTVKVCSAMTLVFGGAAAASHYGINGLAATTTIITAVENVILWLLARILTGLWTHPSIGLRKPRLASAPERLVDKTST